MHAWKNPDLVLFPLLFFLVLHTQALLAKDIHAQSSGIIIEKIKTGTVNKMFTLNADIDYQLSEETITALEHGVALVFDIEFRLKRERQWMWDKTIAKKMISYRIEHQPLTGHYLVSEIDNGRLHQFNNLVSALDFIGNINQFPLVDVDMLAEHQRYIAQIKTMLNIQSLPAPLRPLAYLSSDWHLSSSWHNLVIQQ